MTRPRRAAGLVIVAVLAAQVIWLAATWPTRGIGTESLGFPIWLVLTLLPMALVGLLGAVAAARLLARPSGGERLAQTWAVVGGLVSALLGALAIGADPFPGIRASVTTLPLIGAVVVAGAIAVLVLLRGDERRQGGWRLVTSTIRLAAVSDSHLVAADQPASGMWHNRLEFETALPRLEVALQGSADANPDAIVALGDIANFGDDASLDTALARFAATRTTAWLVGGNHDTRGTAGGHALEQAIARAGNPGVRMPPPGGVAWHGIAIAGVPLDQEDDGYRSRIHAGLGQDVPSADPLIVLTHFPMLSLERDVVSAGWKYAGDLVDLAAVAAPLLERSGPTIVLHGHLHLAASRTQGRVLQIGCPPLIEAPFEISHVVIERDAAGLIEVAVNRQQIWPTDGVASWPQLVPERQAWRYDGTSWQSAD